MNLESAESLWGLGLATVLAAGSKSSEVQGSASCRRIRKFSESSGVCRRIQDTPLHKDILLFEC